MIKEGGCKNIEVIKANRTVKHKNSDVCSALEYSMDNGDISGAVVSISGRHPDEERVVNKKCYELVFVPESHADAVRKAIGNASAGKIGNYDFCSFSIKGVGRFRPLAGAKPVIGEVGKLGVVNEERIEFICPESLVDKVFKSIKKAHPYEEVALDIYPLLDYE